MALDRGEVGANLIGLAQRQRALVRHGAHSCPKTVKLALKARAARLSRRDGAHHLDAMTLDLAEDEARALAKHLRQALDYDPYPLALRLDPLKAILAKP